MESSAFTQDETSTADPFGDDGQGDFTQDDPLAEAEAAEALRAEHDAGATAEPVEGIPVVGADGQEIEAATQDAEPDAEPEAETTTPIAQREAAVAAAAATPSVGSDGLPIPTLPAKPDPTPAAASTPTASAPADSGSSDTPTPAGATAISDSTPAEPSDDAAEPEATKTHRKYVLLAPDGEGKFTQVSWYEDKKGEMVAKGTASAKKQNVCLASGQDQALGIGWRALGCPENGCALVAVAAGYFQIRNVGPDREPPKNPRLKIR